MPSENQTPFKNRWLIEGKLVTCSPFHLGDGNEIPWAHFQGERDEIPLIKSIFRDVRGLPCIPGSSLKGALRAAIEDFGQHEKAVEAIFGRQASEDHEGEGGSAEFHDCRVPEQFAAPPFKHPPPWWDALRLSGIESGIAIDRCTRTVEQSKLFYFEVVPPGVEFTVRISAQNLEPKQIGLLLGLLDRFSVSNAKPDSAKALTLGAGTAGGKGLFRWQLGHVRYLDRSDVAQWIKQPLPAYEATKPWPGGADSLKILAPLTQPGTQPAPLVIHLELKFQAFLVNDPSQWKEGTDAPNHTPLLSDDKRPLLPESTFRGALRSQAERILRTLAVEGADPAAVGELKQPSGPLSKDLGPENFSGVPLAGIIFGTTGWKSPVTLSDSTAIAFDGIPRQEFVGIDRFSGGSALSMKFNADYALNPTFHVPISVCLEKWETAGIRQAAEGLFALVLRDLMEGDVTFGFGASKGYGICRARITNPEGVDWFSKAQPQVDSLRQYLRNGSMKQK